MYFNKNNNTTTQQHLTNGNQTNNVSQTKENINQQLHRRRLDYQILQSQDLQECYNDLISQKYPYVPAKFKVKINLNISAHEIPLYCRNNEKQKELKIEIKTMEEQIKLAINSLRLTTEERDNFYVNEIQKGQERNIREWQKHLDKLVNTFNQ